MAKKNFIYGHNGTIHGNTELDVETDKDGNVVAVWFRCLQLPFKQHAVNEDRAKSMRSAKPEFKLLAVHVEGKTA